MHVKFAGKCESIVRIELRALALVMSNVFFDADRIGAMSRLDEINEVS